MLTLFFTAVIPSPHLSSLLPLSEQALLLSAEVVFLASSTILGDLALSVPAPVALELFPSVPFLLSTFLVLFYFLSSFGPKQWPCHTTVLLFPVGVLLPLIFFRWFHSSLT